jgi:hypothetical protein
MAPKKANSKADEAAKAALLAAKKGKALCKAQNWCKKTNKINK